MTLMSGGALRTLLAALLLNSMSGCKHADECSFDQNHCDGDVAMTCVRVEDSYGSYNIWHTAQCGADRCQTDEDTRYSFCSLAPDPDPRCDGRASFCDGNAIIHCQSGYASSSLDCESKFCVMPNKVSTQQAAPVKQAFCAIESEPNAICEEKAYWSDANVCDGNESISCQFGYALSRTSCGDRFCRNQGTCVMSTDPEPHCVLPKDHSTTFCEDNAVVYCDGSYRYRIHACGAGETCRDRLARCGNTFYGDTCNQASCEP